MGVMTHVNRGGYRVLVLHFNICRERERETVSTYVERERDGIQRERIVLHVYVCTNAGAVMRPVDRQGADRHDRHRQKHIDIQTHLRIDTDTHRRTDRQIDRPAQIRGLAQAAEN